MKVLCLGGGPAPGKLIIQPVDLVQQVIKKQLFGMLVVHQKDANPFTLQTVFK